MVRAVSRATRPRRPSIASQRRCPYRIDPSGDRLPAWPSSGAGFRLPGQGPRPEAGRLRWVATGSRRRGSQQRQTGREDVGAEPPIGHALPSSPLPRPAGETEMSQKLASPNAQSRPSLPQQTVHQQARHLDRAPVINRSTQHEQRLHLTALLARAERSRGSSPSLPTSSLAIRAPALTPDTPTRMSRSHLDPALRAIRLRAATSSLRSVRPAAVDPQPLSEPLALTSHPTKPPGRGPGPGRRIPVPDDGHAGACRDAG